MAAFTRTRVVHLERVEFLSELRLGAPQDAAWSCLRADEPDCGFDASGYCIDAPERSPAGAMASNAFNAGHQRLVRRDGQPARSTL